MVFAAAPTTDYKNDTDPPEPYLRRIAEAGFSHVHWCHEWCTDRLYSKEEVAGFARILGELRLSVHDIHGTAGQRFYWGSPDETARQMGVVLVINRLDMAAALGCPVVIMHPPGNAAPANVAGRDRFFRTLDELAPEAQRRGVRLALENLPDDNIDIIEAALARFGADVLGLCYDSGHGNLGARRGLDRLDPLKDRIIATHLHDNDGTGDHHKPMFAGTVDWLRLARIIAASPYARPALTNESVQRLSNLPDDGDFLRNLAATHLRFAAMIEAARQADRADTDRPG